MTASRWAALSLAAALCWLGCSPGDDAPDSATLKFAFVSPDPLGVNPFLMMGQTGIEQAAAIHGAEAFVLESEDAMTREENLRAAVAEGVDSELFGATTAAAPETDFVIVDHCLEEAPANVHCAVFREHDGSFLIGAAAGLLTESGKVGTIGVADIPFLHRYTEGFAAGVRHVRPEVEVEVRWVGGENPFADPVRAKEQALALAASGVDHIYTAAAAGNLGVFEAATAEGFYAYGIDVDQCPRAPGRIVDNMMKRVDRAIVEATEAILSGAAGEMLVYGLDSGGIELTALEEAPSVDSECLVLQNPELVTELRALAAQIVAGEIGIEDPMGILD